MKLFVLVGLTDYEPSKVLGVYSTELKAIEELALFILVNPIAAEHVYDDFKILDMTLDQSADKHSLDHEDIPCKSQSAS